MLKLESRNPVSIPDQSCCFRGCTVAGSPPVLIEVHLPRDRDNELIIWSHEECLWKLAARDIAPDDPQDHGHIPGKARCVFCGRLLPVVGRHPYSFDVGSAVPPRRYWAHAECLAERLVQELTNRL